MLCTNALKGRRSHTCCRFCDIYCCRHDLARQVCYKYSHVRGEFHYWGLNSYLKLAELPFLVPVFFCDATGTVLLKGDFLCISAKQVNVERARRPCLSLCFWHTLLPCKSYHLVCRSLFLVSVSEGIADTCFMFPSPNSSHFLFECTKMRAIQVVG